MPTNASQDNIHIGLSVRDCTVVRDPLCRGSQHTLAIKVLVYIGPLPIFCSYVNIDEYYDPYVNILVSFFCGELVDVVLLDSPPSYFHHDPNKSLFVLLF